jgi:hypothetical protein
MRNPEQLTVQLLLVNATLSQLLKKLPSFLRPILKPEDLQNVRVSSLLSLVANTGLGLVS